MKLNHIYKTSCVKGLKKLPDASVDLIFTDPPYYQYRAQNVKGLKNHKDVVTEFEFDGFNSEEEYLQFLEDVLTECFRVCKDGGSGYLWCGDDFVSYINRIVEKVGFKFRKVIHWHKTNPFPAIHTRKMFANSMEMMVHFSKGTPNTWNHKPVNEMHNFIQTPICMGKERKKHKTQKPLKVCIPYIEISSNEGEIVLDPFMGSGTTAIACLKTNRKYIGYEINPEYHKIIKERISELKLENPPPSPRQRGKPKEIALESPPTKGDSLNATLDTPSPSLRQQGKSTGIVIESPPTKGDSLSATLENPSPSSRQQRKSKGIVLESPPLEGDKGGGNTQPLFSENNYHYNKSLKDLANKLRKNMTIAEASAWKYLFSKKQMLEYQFRRQRPIDKYIVDFACLPLGLIIEIDGATHDGEKAKQDRKRDLRLKKLGFTTLRFNDEDILKHINGVKNNIEGWIKKNAIAPPPRPRQQGK